MEPDQHFCINWDCPHFGKSGTGTIKVYSYKERRYYCVTCGKTFSESRASLFYHLRTPRRDVLEAIGMLAERHSLIIPLCSMPPKFLKLLKRGHENASRGSLANPPLASICA